jgi:hypothetical protein
VGASCWFVASRQRASYPYSLSTLGFLLSSFLILDADADADRSLLSDLYVLIALSS